MKMTWVQVCLIAHVLISALAFIFTESDTSILQFTISWAAFMITLHIDERGK